MCNLFLSQDPAAHTPETRAIRLHGHSTAIRHDAASGSAGYGPRSARAQHARA